MTVLRAGELDEQIFLAEDACQKIGIEPVSESEAHDTLCRSLSEHVKKQRTVGLQTPLTGRGLLINREPGINLSPVSTATQGASKLHTLLAGRNSMPSEALSQMLAQIVPNPAERIDQTIKEMGELFCTAYAKRVSRRLLPSLLTGLSISSCEVSRVYLFNRCGDAVLQDEDADAPTNPDLFDFAKKRLQLGEALFYTILESIINLEQNPQRTLNNFSVSLRQEQFQKSLFASCLEIVMYSYNSQETLFPWILNVFGLKGYHYYRIIEPMIRAEQRLSRDVVKHFNKVSFVFAILSSLCMREQPLRNEYY